MKAELCMASRRGAGSEYNSFSFFQAVAVYLDPQKYFVFPEDAISIVLCLTLIHCSVFALLVTKSSVSEIYQGKLQVFNNYTSISKCLKKNKWLI